MALSIDTIRSLDASKSYYIANSPGEIAEATPWQKFKCFLGIGDGRHKAAKLLDEVKVALLQASGETDNAELSADIAQYDEQHSWCFSLSGRSLSAIASRFSAANATKIAQTRAKAIAEAKINASMRTIHECFRVEPGATRPDALAFLRRAVKPFVDAPPMKTLPDGGRVLDAAAFEKLVAEALAKAEDALVRIFTCPKLKCYAFDRAYTDHVFETLYGKNGLRNERPVEDLRPADEVRLEAAARKLGREGEEAQARLRDLLKACGNDPAAIDVATKNPARFLVGRKDKLRSAEDVAKLMAEWKAFRAETLKACAGNTMLLRVAESSVKVLNGKKLPAGMISKVVASARAVRLQHLPKIGLRSEPYDIHKGMVELYNTIQRLLDETGLMEKVDGQDDLIPYRWLISACLLEKVNAHALRHMDAAFETPEASRLYKLYDDMARNNINFPEDDLSAGLLGTINSQCGSIYRYMYDLKKTVDIMLALPVREMNGAKGAHLDNGAVGGINIFYDIKENSIEFARKQRLLFGERTVTGTGPAAERVRGLCMGALEEMPFKPVDTFQRLLTPPVRPLLSKAVMTDAQKVFRGELKDTGFAQKIADGTMEVELVNMGKLSADPDEALDQLARYVTRNEKATFAALDEKAKTKVALFAGLLGDSASNAVFNGIDAKLGGVRMAGAGVTETRKVVLEFTRSGAINCKLVSERTGTTVVAGEEELAVGPGSSMKVNASLSLSNKEVNALEENLDLNAFDPDAEIDGPYLLNMPPVGADASFTINDAEPGV